jgi:RND superfamily putative drug exporter
MVLHFGRWIHDARWGVVGAWILAVILLRLVAPSWSQVAMDGDLEYLPSDTTTVRAAELSARAFPDDRSKSQIVIVVARDEGELSAVDRQFALDLGRQIDETPDLGVVDVWTEKTPVVGSHLRSADGRAGRLVIRLTNEFMATDNIRVLSEIKKLVDARRPDTPPGLRVGITGSAAIGGDMLTAAAQSVANTHYTTILLVTIALLAIYRSLWLALVPLAAIGIAVVTSFDLLAILAHWSHTYPDAWPVIRVFTTTKIFVIVLLFGAGTDYCLFLTARFREQRAKGLDQREAVATALGHVGVALVASALTTIVGLAMMGFAQFGKFTYSGPAIAVGLAVTLLACVTLVPALLSTRLGAAVGNGNEAKQSVRWQAFWRWLADGVLRRPGTILLASMLLAAPLVWVGWSVDVTYDLLGELSPDRVSRQGTALLRRHFPPGEVGPLVVFARHEDGELDSLDGQLRIAALAKPLDDLPAVSHVRSLYRPTGASPGAVSVFSAQGLMELAAPGSPLTKAVFVAQEGPLAGKVTRLFLILRQDPFSAEAMSTCDDVRQLLSSLSEDASSPWHNASFELSGTTAGLRDLKRVTLADRHLIQLLVAGAVWVVIVVLLRRPVICLFLIATVLLSYFVTMGISDLAFHALRGDAYVGLDWKVPLFLFVILVAVGQDYNIYLVSRVLEEQRTLGRRAGLRRALIRTGGIITSCGVIMAGTFISMTTAELHGMVELGFALSLGILLDTFVVRTIVVPAFLALVARE